MTDDERIRAEGGGDPVENDPVENDPAADNPAEEKSWADYDRAEDELERQKALDEEAARAESGENSEAGGEPSSENDTDGQAEPDGTEETYAPDGEGPYDGEYPGYPEEYEYEGGEEETEYDGGEESEYDGGDWYDDEEEPENLAEIAERILGARHSKVSTAAPIRTHGDRQKENEAQAAPENRDQSAVNPAAAVIAAGTAQGLMQGPAQGAAAENAPGPAPVSDSGMQPVPASPEPGAQNPAYPAYGQTAEPVPDRPAENPAFSLTAERQAAAVREAERKTREAEAKARRKRALTIVASVLVLALLAAAVGIGISIAAKKKPNEEKINPIATDTALPADNAASGETAENEGKTDAPDEPGGTADPGTADEPGGTDEPGTNTEPGTDDEPGTEPGTSPSHGGEEDPAGTGEGEPAGTDDPSGSDSPADETPGEDPAQDPGETPAEDPGKTPDETEPPAGTETDPAQSGGEGTPAAEEPVTETPGPVPEPAKKIRVRVEFYDRDPIVTETEPTTLAEILSDKGVKLGEGEVPSVGQGDRLTEDITITVDKYEYVNVDETVTVPFEREEIGIDTIPRGSTYPIQEGSDGETVYHYVVAYKNGEEIERHLSSEEVISVPVNEQVYLGVGGTIVGRDWMTYSYSWKRVCSATYYSDPDLTWLGNYAGPGTAAADFSNIPLGTKIYVKNDRYDFGVCTVEDTGERFDPWQVDIWLDPSDPYYPLIAEEGYVYDMVIYFLD